MRAFPCTQCGKCCTNVDLAPETALLDRGDGVCRFLDTNTKLCGIYESRPDICRIDLQFRRNYSQQFSWEQFIELNLQVCETLPLKLK